MPRLDTQVRRAERAKFLRATTDMSPEEIGAKIAKELGRDKPFAYRTVRDWFNTETSPELERGLEEHKRRVREEVDLILQRQMKEVIEELEYVQRAVPVYETDGDGDVIVHTDADGNPVPQIESWDVITGGKDAYLARKEIREIMEQRIDLWGANEPVEVNITHDVDDDLVEEAAGKLDL